MKKVLRLRAARPHWLLLPLLVLPALWPFYTRGLPHSSDGTLHLLRVIMLDHHIQQGVVYPRWTPELVLGLGYPLFNFYAPLVYYLAELFHIVGLSVYHSVLFSFATLLLVAAGGMYLFARDIFGSGREWAALVAAAAYTYSPYLLTNVFVRGALAEVAAQALLPWVFWSARRVTVAKRPQRYVVPAALSLAALAVTHNITLLLLPPALLAYLLFLWWQQGRHFDRLRWPSVAILTAVGISAFFWMPVLAERRYLSTASYQLSADLFLPENVWTWRNFLDAGLVFEYTSAPPFQLGLVQALLAVAGALLLWRFGGEWRFWSAVLLVSSLAIGKWALPLWASNDILLTVQFPWRLLAIISIPLAVLTAGLVFPIRRGTWQAVAAVGLIVIIIGANHVTLDPWTELLRIGNVETLPAVAQFESQKGGKGLNFTGDFKPAWVHDDETYVPADESALSQSSITLHSGNDYGMTATVSSQEGGPLRFATFYFPGWKVEVDGGTVLSAFPSTTLGLLTVDLPPGTHDVRLIWTGTTLHRLGVLMSVAALVGLVWFCWRRCENRWPGIVPAGLLIVVGAAALRAPEQLPIHTPQEPLITEHVQLLGVRVAPASEHHLSIHPYWYVRAQAPEEFRVSWQLADERGALVSERVNRPYFDGVDAENWPPGTIVDDAYRLPLPPGLSAGTYTLNVQILPGEGSEASERVAVDEIQIPRTVSDAPPSPAQQNLDVTVGDGIELAGYDAAVNGYSIEHPRTQPSVVRAGDVLEYILYWQASGAVKEKYHGFVHLVDANGRTVMRQDQLPGTPFWSPVLWDAVPKPDRYRMVVSDTVTSGVYWPHVGLYDFETLQRLPVTDRDGQSLGTTTTLAPTKVLNEPTAAPDTAASARFGDMGTLYGYDVTPAAGAVRAGRTFTLTLYYRTDEPTSSTYTRFVHVYNPDLGMAVQQDSQPQNGVNPTWAWVPNEEIVDTVSLQVPNDTPPGQYEVRVGFYEPATGRRLPVTGETGRPLPDGQVTVTKICIEP